MQTKELDGNIFRRILAGGAKGIRLNIELINELNVFPVPDGDTGTNMSRTIESGLSKISFEDDMTLSKVAANFATGSLLGARGNSGVILSQFFAGVCGTLENKEKATAADLATAYSEGVKRSYSAVSKPVEGTILTVFRESAEFARKNINEESTLEDFLRLNIEEAERSLMRTKEILPILTEADVVDSGGAGYLCIARGMYEALSNDISLDLDVSKEKESAEVDYSLFDSDSVLEYGYCTECLVRLQKAKTDIDTFDSKKISEKLESMGCDSVIALKEGDILKLHAHTATPGEILSLCQLYGEFLNVKIENMSLQHSEKSVMRKAPKRHKRYGIITVATGEGMTALFESLGADIVIDGGQTGNPSAEQFLSAIETLDAEYILILPNNGNILLTAEQAKKLCNKEGVEVIPTKTLPEGYAALSVFNSSITDIDAQIADIISAKEAVVSGELTVAIRDTSVDGINVKKGEYIGILDGRLSVSEKDEADALCGMIEQIEDIDDREIITLFVGDGVSDESRVRMTEALEEKFDTHSVDVYIGGQEIYRYLVAVE